MNNEFSKCETETIQRIKEFFDNLPEHIKQLLNDLDKGIAVKGVLMFELRGDDDHIWKLYSNGRTEGFPEGACMFNHAYRVIDLLRALWEEEVKKRIIKEVELNAKVEAKA